MLLNQEIIVFESIFEIFFWIMILSQWFLKKKVFFQQLNHFQVHEKVHGLFLDSLGIGPVSLQGISVM